MLSRDDFDEEQIAILDSLFPPSPRPDGDEGTTNNNVQVSGDGNNCAVATDVSNHTSVSMFPGLDFPLMAGDEGTSNVQASGNGGDNHVVTGADASNSSYIDVSAFLAGFDFPSAAGNEGTSSVQAAGDGNNYATADALNDDYTDVISAILGIGNEGTSTAHVPGNDDASVDPSLLPSASTVQDYGNGNNGVVATDAPSSVNALQFQGSNLPVTSETMNAPTLDTEIIRPADVCNNKPGDDMSPPCFTLPEGFSPSFLLDSPVFLPDSPVLPSPTTGTFSSIFPGSTNQYNFVSAITDQSNKNKGKEIMLEQGGSSSSFANNHGAAANNNMSFQQNMSMHHQILPPVPMMNTANALPSGVHPPLYHGTGISFPSSLQQNAPQHSVNPYPQGNNNSSFFAPVNIHPASGGVTSTANVHVGNNHRVGGGGGGVASSSEQIPNSVPVPDNPPASPLGEEDQSRNGAVSKSGKYISMDGYNWRKYGEKNMKGSDFPRSYYKCTYQDCPVKKKVEWEPDGHVTELIYSGEHNHPKPAPPPKRGPPQPENQTTTGSTSNEEEPAAATAESDASASKRRRFESHAAVPLATGARRSVKQERIIFQTESEEDNIEDGYRWRKYGQKIVKGNPNPRSYYKCTTPGCEVRKHVERATDNRIMVIHTYEGKHNHEAPIPPRRAQNQGQEARLHMQRPGPPPIPSGPRPGPGPSQGGLAGRGLIGNRPRVHGNLPSNLINKSIGNVNNATANNQSLGRQLGETSGNVPEPGPTIKPVTASGGSSTAASGGPNNSASGGSFATFYGGLSGSTSGGSYATFYGGLSSSRSRTAFCGGPISSARGGSNATNVGSNNATSYGRLNTASNGGGLSGRSIYQQFHARLNAAPNGGGGGVGSSSISQHFNGVLNNVANGVSNNSTGNGVLSATGNAGLNNGANGGLNASTGNGVFNATSNGGLNTTSSGGPSIYEQLFISAGFGTASNAGLYPASNAGGGASVYQQVNGGLYTPSNGGLLNNTGANGGLNATTSYDGFNNTAAYGGLNTTGNGGLNNNQANGLFNSATANGGLNNNGVNGGLNATGNGGFNSVSASGNGGLNAPANGGLNTTGNGGLNYNGVNGGFNSDTAYGGLNAPANGGLNAAANGGAGGGSSSMYQQFPGSRPPPQM